MSVGKPRMNISLSIACLTVLYGRWVTLSLDMENINLNSCIYIFGSNVLTVNLMYCRSTCEILQNIRLKHSVLYKEIIQVIILFYFQRTKTNNTKFEINMQILNSLH